MLVNFVYGGKLGIKIIMVAITAKYKDSFNTVFIILFTALTMNPIVKADTCER